MMIVSISLRRLTGLLVAVILLCTVPSGAYAWGEKGHRIVGHMARALLSPATQRAIRQLMGSDDLATFALYLDLHKDQLDQQIDQNKYDKACRLNRIVGSSAESAVRL